MKMCCMILTVLVLMSVSVLAETADKSVARKDRPAMPITIKSNELTADNKGKTAIFVGKVVAKQGEMTIFADKLVINYSDNKGEIKNMEADGNVRIVQQDRTGLSTHAVYDSASGRITLTGNPRVIKGTDSVKGKEIVYFVDDDKSMVSGGTDSKERVEAVINPPARKGNAVGR